jgi:cellulose synthase/poly-beta-1,6-N-acetylglucosamine synthase-like glycosyltransferase
MKYFWTNSFKNSKLTLQKCGVSSMLCDKTVAVVVPAYNEEKQIGQVLDTMPSFVDRIIIVNDCSKDNTAAIVLDYIGRYQSVRQIARNDTTTSLDNKYNHV